MSRGYVFKRRRFAVLSTTLTSPSLRIQCDFYDKEQRELDVPDKVSEQVSESVWEHGEQTVVFIFVGSCLTVFPLAGFLRIVFVLLVEGWFLP